MPEAVQLQQWEHGSPQGRENTREKAECKTTAVQGLSKSAQY